MKIISHEESQAAVSSLTDGLGRPVDSGIAEALTHFVRFVQALGFETVQSCEGHIDWGHPFPWIDFRVPHEKVNLPPSWQVWKVRSRIQGKREDERHWRNEERKTDQLCTMMSRYLILYTEHQKAHPETILHIARWQRTRFRLQPAYTWLSEGHKRASNHEELDRLLQLQRQSMSSFGSFCVAHLEKETNLVGVPDEGCRGCMGRG